MNKIGENYLEYYLRADNDIGEINLVGFDSKGLVIAQMFNLPRDQALFQGINKNNSKIFINDKELQPFSLWYYFKDSGTYKVKIELNEKISDLAFLFYKCIYITNIDLSHLDLSEIHSMEGTFESCKRLEEINLGNAKTDKLNNLYGTFCDCNNLKEIKGIENLNTKNVEIMRCFHGCKKLEKLNLQKWNTSNVTNMLFLFKECENLTELNLSGWENTNVKDMHEMFKDCKKLKNLNLKNFSTKSRKYGKHVHQL